MKNPSVNLKTILAFLVLVSFGNCKNESVKQSKPSWSDIHIYLEGQIIEIYKTDDLPGFSRITFPKDSMQNFNLSDQEKDSVYSLVNRIIENPIEPGHLIAAEYAETASFVISTEEKTGRAIITTTLKKIDFQFIKSWKTISDDTKALHLLLAKKIKFVGK